MGIRFLNKKPDTGINSIVIVDKTKYLNKIESLLDKATRFEKKTSQMMGFRALLSTKKNMLTVFWRAFWHYLNEYFKECFNSILTVF